MSNAMAKGKIIRFLSITLATYTVLWSLLEPLGLFGWSDSLGKLRGWGYALLIVFSAVVGYATTFFRAHLHALRMKVAPPVQISQAAGPSTDRTLLEKYDVLDELYDNPLSQVYKVRNRYDGKVYLLKRIKNKASYNPDVIQKVRIAYQDNHISGEIALPIEIIEDETSYYEVLEYFDGWTVGEIIKSNQNGVYGSLLDEWTREILDILFPLHRNKLVHRDINPYNVLVRSDTLSFVFLDFSHTIFLSKKREYIPLDSPGFTAPEQRESNYSTSTDIYSVGALLLYMNSCKIPPTLDERKYRGKDIKLTNITRNKLDQAIHKMLALDPKSRFQNAFEAYEFLKSHGTTEIYAPNALGELKLPDNTKIVMGKHNWRRVEAHEDISNLGPF